MIDRWFRDYRPSLRRWTRVLAFIWLLSASVAAPIAVGLLEQIYNDARITYTKEIPDLLDRNRNAVKLERLSSFIRTISSASEPREQRRTLVQLQALAQGFDLDGDTKLSQGTAQVVANAQRILALRAAHQPTTDHLTDGSSAEVMAQRVRQLSDEALRSLAVLADDVTTDAAFKADKMASRIQANAAAVEYGCVAALAFFIAFGIFLFWFFQTHVLRPIARAVGGLEVISNGGEAEVKLAHARFFELDTIGRSVEQYAKFALELSTANAALHTLSSQDSLTGLANRRTFDAALDAICQQSGEDVRLCALLLIDIDHFKALNDRFGHLIGDQYLKQVGAVLRDFCFQNGGQAARYGGEEFGVILYDVVPELAIGLADNLRMAVASHEFDNIGLESLPHATVSIGVAHNSPGRRSSPAELIQAADEAMYRAKRAGRNVVCAAEPAQDAALRASAVNARC